MIIFGCALLIALFGTSLLVAPKLRSGRSLIQLKIRAMPPQNRVSMGFFLAALALVASDQIYWIRFSQTPNYLAVLAALGAVVGLGYRTRFASNAAPALDESSLDRSAEWWSAFAVFSAFLAFYAVTGTMTTARTMPMSGRQ